MRSRFAPLLYSRYLLVVAWALLVVALFFIALDAFVFRHHGDSDIFLYVAKGILEGEIPYLERWDHKGPLLYLINACALLVHPTWGVWVVQGLFLLATSCIALLTLRKAFELLPALFALAVFLILFRKFSYPGNFSEQYGLLFQFLALYLFLRSHEREDRKTPHLQFAIRHLAIGALGAASFLLRPDLVALWIAIGLFWLLLRDIHLRKLVWAILGGGSVLLLAGGYFLAVGAWGALWNALFVYNFAHSDASNAARLEAVRLFAERTFPASLLVIAGWCLGVAYCARGLVRFPRLPEIPERYKAPMYLVVILLPLEVASLSLSGFGFRHYYLTALPALMLLLAFLPSFLVRERPLAITLLSAALFLGAVAYASPHTSVARLAEKYTSSDVLVEDWDTHLAKFVKEVTGPDDYLLVWGKSVRIQLLSERDAPTRFFYQYPLVKPHYTDESIRDTFLADLNVNKPLLILDMRHPRLPPIANAEREGWRPEPRYAIDPLHLKPFFDLVERDYVPINVFEDYLAYVLKTDAAIDLSVVKGDLIIQSNFNVYLDGRTLTYVQTKCAEQYLGNRFILHVVPVDKSIIGNNAHQNMDFTFLQGKAWQLGEGCVVSVDLPDYPIAYFRTGQYNETQTADIWLTEYHLNERE